jgi:hypothetical protein
MNNTRDVAYINGTIITMNANDSIEQAVLVRAGTIKAVGSTAHIMALSGGDTTTIDLHEKVMLPGFIDPHSHFPMSGMQALYRINLNSPPIGTVNNLNDVIGRLKARAATTPKGEWVVGLGYDDTLLSEKKHPTNIELDRATTEHPVLIRHISGHVGVLNSYALKMLSIDKHTPQPSGGQIGKDGLTGEPNGFLAEEPLIDLFYSPHFRLSFDQTLCSIEYAAREYASVGVTTVQMGCLRDGDLLNALIKGLQSGKQRNRLVVWATPSFIDQVTSGRIKVEGLEESTITLRTAKLFADGSIQAYTGYLSRPYHIPPSNETPDYRGVPMMSRNELAARVKDAHRKGLQIAIHCNGDAAIDDALFAFENAQVDFPRGDPRHVVVHSQMARNDQLDRMKALGVIPSFFSLHTYYWGDRHTDIFMGPDRAARMSPAKAALDRGMRFTIHTDTPVVPINPLLLVWAAVNRISTGGRVIGPDQRITPLQALRAITINAAWQAFQDDSLGSIECGKHADFVVLSDNPLTAPTAIRDIRVLETIVAGETIFKAPDSAS